MVILLLVPWVALLTGKGEAWMLLLLMTDHDGLSGLVDTSLTELAPMLLGPPDVLEERSELGSGAIVGFKERPEAEGVKIHSDGTLGTSLAILREETSIVNLVLAMTLGSTSVCVGSVVNAARGKDKGSFVGWSEILPGEDKRLTLVSGFEKISG